MDKPEDKPELYVRDSVVVSVLEVGNNSLRMQRSFPGFVDPIEGLENVMCPCAEGVTIPPELAAPGTARVDISNVRKKTDGRGYVVTETTEITGFHPV